MAVYNQLKASILGEYLNAVAGNSLISTIKPSKSNPIWHIYANLLLKRTINCKGHVTRGHP